MPMLRDQGAVLMDAGEIYGRRIGGGLFSEVFVMPDGKVMKVCRSIDGTYWWLKYAHALTLAGVSRPMVPVVYELARVDYRGSPGYVAIMEHYECAKDYIDEIGLDAESVDKWLYGWRGAMRDFDAWCASVGVGKVPFNDLHHGNVMFNADADWVITDPSSASGAMRLADTTENFLKGFYEHQA